MTTWDVVRAELRAMNQSGKPESWSSFAIQTGVVLVTTGVVQVLLAARGRDLSWGFLAVFLGTWTGVSAFDTGWRVRRWRAAAGPLRLPPAR
ncbi:MAG TPA: hypothetical protein VK640_02595 [Actinomycetes bacterium]|nr:hypothetical protein [Actinomycetes bacterium]